MTREEHLKFCKQCENKNFNPKKGIICGLTGEIADFDNECLHFTGNNALMTDVSEKEGTAEESNKKLKKFFSLFLIKQGYFSTPIILYICVFVFILMVISGVHIIHPDIDSLIFWGANFKPLVLQGQVWRLITNCFLHIGILHLLFNMYALIYIGLLLEPIINKFRIWIAFIITGIGGSAVSFWWNDLVVSAGASGAIFGLYGVYIALLLSNIMEKESKKQILSSLLFFVGYNLFYGMKAGIDNAAHIGGLISGVLYGFSLYPSLVTKNNKIRNLFINTSAVAVTIVFAVLVIVKTPNNFANYDDLMARFTKLEEDAVKVFNMMQGADESKILTNIQNTGIPNWKECKEILNQIDTMDYLPEQAYINNELLKMYIEYRIDSYHLIEESIIKQTRRYEYRINMYNKKIELIIKKLQGELIADNLLEIKPFTDIISDFPKNKLFVVDGYPVYNLEKINQDEIYSIQEINEKLAISIYGDKAKNGAVLISTNTNK